MTVRTQSGWTMTFEPWTPEFSLQSAPVERAVAAMNQALESQIARAPEQYLWAYNRYKIPYGAALPQEALPE
jgi:KDO2-lipid IV(A) lauroyltransferase